MPITHVRPRSVFVPYEYSPDLKRKRRVNYLPRFVEPEQAFFFLWSYPAICHLIQWEEEFDETSIDEYLHGVGGTGESLFSFH